MKNSTMTIAAASLLSIAVVSNAGAQTEAAPILVDESVAAVEARIDETPMTAPATAMPMPVEPMDVMGAMPAATVMSTGSNAVAAIELEADGAIQLGSSDIDVRMGTLEDVDQGSIEMMQPEQSDVAPEFNDEIKVGDLYYGQDGNVYRFTGNSL